MKHILFLFVFLCAVCVSDVYAAACVSAGNGNWSATGTWSSCGGGVPGDGDTASIGHNVTVDVNTTVGTSPNDATTAAITWTGSGKILTIAAGVTLTVKGNLVSIFTLGVLAGGAGSTLNFDNSSSGGTPLYGPTIALAYQFTGTSNNPAIITAPSGRLHAALRSRVAYGGTALTYVNISRMNGAGIDVRDMGSTYNFTFSHVNFDACTRLNISEATIATTTNFTWDYVTVTNSVDTESVQIQVDGTKTSGTRRIYRCAFDKAVLYISKGFDITESVFLGGISANSGFDWASFRLNLSAQDGNLNASAGARFPNSSERNYIMSINFDYGNPHFINVVAKSGVDNVVSQNIFHAHQADIITPDSGDCIIVQGTAMTAGLKVIAKNNLVLLNSMPGTSVTSGSLLTLYAADADVVTEWHRNTANLDTTAGANGKLAMFDVAEANTGYAGQVAVLKSNLGWSDNADQNYFVARLSGNVKDIVTAAGADYNWLWNASAGNNQRGYTDWVLNNTLWTAGDAVAAGVDAHQGSGNPAFYDSSRNIGTWAIARGYGSDYAAGLAACAADTTRVADLINYVFEGFRPGNASMRNAAHDGGVVGAANYYKSTRTLTTLNQHRAGLSKFGL